MRHSLLVIVALALAAPVGAQDAYRVGRIRSVEPSATLQRGDDDVPDEARPNTTFAPGDRLLTDGSGRVELQFGADLVRLDSRSTLEYGNEGRGRLVLRLDSGGVYLRPQRGGLGLETPGGFVEAGEGGIYRVDVAQGETRLSVVDGSASLDSADRRVDLRSGERTYARRGQPPEDPQPFDRNVADDFAVWDRQLGERLASYGGESRRYVPEEVAPYARELDEHGSWQYRAEEGYVWHPYVAEDWTPYCDGRWSFGSVGWTWNPYESWGWAPFHYGRWGFGAGLGWYWIPGRVWGPAWVSWALGGGYVGWCPLGFRDAPIVNLNVNINGHRSPWIYTRAGALASVNAAQARVALNPGLASSLRVVGDGHLQPSRDLKTLTPVRALPVAVARTRPTMGDTVPELRHDPSTSIPGAVGFHGILGIDDTRFQRGGGASRTGSPALTPSAGAPHPTDRRNQGGGGAGSVRATPSAPAHPTDHRSRAGIDYPAPRTGDDGTVRALGSSRPSTQPRTAPEYGRESSSRPVPGASEGSHPTDRRSPASSTPVPRRGSDASPRSFDTGRPADRRAGGSPSADRPRGAFEGSRPADSRAPSASEHPSARPDREVLRPFFEPLSQPRGGEGSHPRANHPAPSTRPSTPPAHHQSAPPARPQPSTPPHRDKGR